jgi:hypothetical protein
LSLRDWPGRNKMLLRLLVIIPLGYLFNATCFLLDYVFFPSLWRQKVQRPVFVVGHARSGSTLTHRLLAADGDTFSYFLYWEMFFPSLLQKKFIGVMGWVDAHLLRRAINRRLVAWDDKTFGPYRKIHDMSLWNSEEDQFVMRGAFVTQQWSLDIPMMDILDIFHVDQMSQRKRMRWMHHYRECVKRQLVLKGPDKTHLAKNPLMSGWVQSLIDTFPDARVAVVMRNPAQCVPSVLKLVEVTWRGKGWEREDYADSLRMLTEVSFETFHHPKEVLAGNPKTPQIVVDYRELTSAPRATVHKIYAAFDLPLSAEFDAHLAEREQQEKSHKSDFHYSIDEYEVSLETIEAELHTFYEQYGWPLTSQADSNK